MTVGKQRNEQASVQGSLSGMENRLWQHVEQKLTDGILHKRIQLNGEFTLIQALSRKLACVPELCL